MDKKESDNTKVICVAEMQQCFIEVTINALFYKWILCRHCSTKNHFIMANKYQHSTIINNPFGLYIK